MALHFTANQFEDPYKPTRLGNWEVPKWYPEKPCRTNGITRIISNDRGHLLPGVPRAHTNPWGNFVATWHLPKKITRDVADNLSAPDAYKVKAWKRYCEYQSKSDKKRKQKVEKSDIVETKKENEENEDQVEEKVADEPKEQVESKDTEQKPLCPVHDFPINSKRVVKFE